MAVDLTTGSYDEEGVFSKYNDEKNSEKFKAEDNFCSLKNFRMKRILRECLEDKSLVVEGFFIGDDRSAIIVVEKIPFDARDLARILSADSRLELKFRNNIYANYHVYPSSGFNGFSIQLIHPAREEDFLKFEEQHLRMVNETPELYKMVTLPFLTSISEGKQFQDNGNVLCKEDDPENGFTLFDDKPEPCSCSDKHVRGICVVNKKDILSLRSLTSENAPLLIKIKEKCLRELEARYSIPSSKLLCYICYPPVRFPFHVIFESVEKDCFIPTEKAHHLETVLSNLKLVPDYYKKVTLTYSLSEKDLLYSKVGESQSKD